YMALGTALLAVGEGDVDRDEELAETVVDIAGPAGATVTLAHVFTTGEFETVTEQLDYDPAGEADSDEVAARHATIRSIGDRLSADDVAYSVRGAVGLHGKSIVS